MNRRFFPLILALLGVLLLSGSAFGSDMPTWLARAQEYYVEGVDEFALLQNPYSNDFEAIKPGMIAPNFTLLDLQGNEYTLSNTRGTQFVMLITGSWY